MSDKLDTSDLSDISQTMLLTLYLRYMESKLDGGIIRAPEYSYLVRQLDYNFSKFKDFSDLQLFLAARTVQTESLISEFLNNNECGTVVCIAAGLGISFTLNNNPDIDWYDLDLPPVIELRKKLFPKQDNHHYIAASAWDETWMETISSDKPILVVIEGLLLYFSEEKIRELFVNLINKLKADELVFDSISKYIRQLEETNNPEYIDFEKTPFVWGIDDIREIEEWHDNLSFDKSLYQSELYDERASTIMQAVLEYCPVGKNIYRVSRFKINKKTVC